VRRRRSAFLAATLVSLVVAGCAARPASGPEFESITLAAPAAGKALLVVFRNHAEPYAVAAQVSVDGTGILQLAERSFGVATVSPGLHSLELEWPPVKGRPEWSGESDWVAGSTYFYELTGAVSSAFSSRSRLALTDARLASVKLRACCRLLAGQTSHPSILAVAPPVPSSAPRPMTLTGIRKGMSQQEVLDLIGAPDSVSSKATLVGKLTLHYSPDRFREYWAYAGVGYVVFTHNGYTNVSSVAEVTADPAAR
jgi:hypothetical protein